MDCRVPQRSCHCEVRGNRNDSNDRVTVIARRCEARGKAICSCIRNHVRIRGNIIIIIFLILLVRAWRGYVIYLHSSLSLFSILNMHFHISVHRHKYIPYPIYFHHSLTNQIGSRILGHTLQLSFLSLYLLR